ncbi:MIP18 protein, partial [Polypterus senegalus]
MLNELNLQLQGKENSMVNMISSVNAFKQKMQHLSSKLQRLDLGNIQKNLASELETQWKVNDNESTVSVEFTPTIPHCSMATLIGLSIKVKLLRSLPDRFKIDVHISPGTHASEQAEPLVPVDGKKGNRRSTDATLPDLCGPPCKALTKPENILASRSSWSFVPHPGQQQLEPAVVQDLHTAVQWVVQNKALFHGHVTMPKYLSLNKEGQQRVLRDMLEEEDTEAKDFFFFVFQCAEDMEHFLKACVDEQGLRVNAMFDI